MRKVLFILGQLSDGDMEWMLSTGRKEPVPRGNVLIREGKAIENVYIVLDGKFSVTVKALGEREVARLGSGEILGEMSFVDARPPSATVTALEDSIVFSLPRGELKEKLDRDTGFAARFYRALAVFLSDRLRSTVSRLGYGEGAGLDEDLEYEDELDATVLDAVHLAGSRFDRMLKRLMAG